MIIVEEDYLKELEDFKKSMSYLPSSGIEKLDYKDIVNIDTYKESFVKFLELSRISTANQRAINIGDEKELMGLINGLGLLIKDIKEIDKVRQNYEDKKEEEKEAKKKNK